jgi:hypothetical protein
MGEEYYIFNKNYVAIYKNASSFYQSLNPFMPITNCAEYIGDISKTPNKYKSIIMYRDLENLSQKSFKKIEFEDRLRGTTTNGYNATANVYNSRGSGHIEYDSFDARTTASTYRANRQDPGDPRIENGIYSGVFTLHRGSYRAIRLKIITENGTLRDSVSLVGANPNYFSQIFSSSLTKGFSLSLNPNKKLGDVKWFATTIDIHRSTARDRTFREYPLATPSTGCLLIRKSKWNKFDQLIDIQRGERVEVHIDTSANKRE